MKKKLKSMLFVCAITCSSAATGWATTTYDMNNYGVSYTIGSTGAVATEFTAAMQPFHSSGTGVINPFLTIDAKGIESGVNTDGTPLPFDDQRPEWNNAITLGDLKNAGYKFAVDINEPSTTSKETLFLDQFKVWVLPQAAGGSLVNKNNVKVGGTDTYTALANLLTTHGGTMAFDLDNGGDNQIKMHYNLWNGSGNNLDMQLEVPSANFSGYNNNSFLYVWAQFSSSDNGGFEEWILMPGETTPPAVPEPGTLMLLGVGMLGLAIYGKRRMNKND